MKWIHRIAISLTIAFFAVCCGAVLLFNWSALGWKALSVPTGSMRPTIPPGSLVLMHRVPVNSLKVGDVITYTNPRTMESTITHRIVKTYKIAGNIPAFVTKGDANPTADRPIVGGLVQGKAIWHVPDVGAWLSWSKTWVGLAVLVYIPALLLMFEEVSRLNLYYRTSKAYKATLVLAREAKDRRKKSRLVSASAISLTMVIAPILIAFPVSALLRSNSVSLGPNHITTASITPPPQCQGNGSTTITVTGGGSSTVTVGNSNNQNANTGNANSNGGTATSGNAGNTNCTNINITIH